jgi:hypothetical protein
MMSGVPGKTSFLKFPSFFLPGSQWALSPLDESDVRQVDIEPSSRLSPTFTLVVGQPQLQSVPSAYGEIFTYNIMVRSASRRERPRVLVVDVDVDPHSSEVHSRV